jgi:MacB-like protein
LRRIPSFASAKDEFIFLEGREDQGRRQEFGVQPVSLRQIHIEQHSSRLRLRYGENGHRVVIINETMARRYWPHGGALGQRLKLTNDWLEIVGVAKDVKNRSLSESPRPLLYLPLLQDYRSNMILVARAATGKNR